MNQPSTDENAFYKDSISRRRPPRAGKRRAKPPKPLVIDEPPIPAIGTMARTRRLILAALRVWELKRGIREY